ncbi:MAG: outer membrane protein transport protein [Pseudomonadota bacterium]
MKTRVLAAAALLLSSTSLYASGLDRSFQNVSAIFANDDTVSFSFSHINPSVSGTDALGGSYDVGKSYEQTTLSFTKQLGDDFTLGFITDQPYGADVFYNDDPATSTLGGTGADLSSEAYKLVGRYRFSPRFSVYGGVQAQTVRASVNLNGQAYRNAIPVAGVADAAGVDSATLGAALQGDPASIAALGGLGVVGVLGAQVSALQNAFDADNGYSYTQDAATEYGWLIGAAYEIPDIALRLAVTYHSEIEYTANTTEQILGNTVTGTVDYVTPQAVNVDFQTGIAKDTLLLASYRWTEFESVDLIPTGLGSDLVNLDDGHRYTLGVGRRFTDNFSGSLILSYEPEGDDDLVSPLGPTDGLFGISVGGRYTKDNMTISGGVNYSWLGDARPEVAGQPVASFTDNSSLAVGFKIDFTF